MRDRLREPVLEPDVVLGERARDVRGGAGVEGVELVDAVGNRAQRHELVAVPFQPRPQAVQAGEIGGRDVEPEDLLRPAGRVPACAQEARARLGRRPRAEDASADVEQVRMRDLVERPAEPAPPRARARRRPRSPHALLAERPAKARAHPADDLAVGLRDPRGHVRALGLAREPVADAVAGDRLGERVLVQQGGEDGGVIRRKGRITPPRGGVGQL